MKNLVGNKYTTSSAIRQQIVDEIKKADKLAIVQVPRPTDEKPSVSRDVKVKKKPVYCSKKREAGLV